MCGIAGIVLPPGQEVRSGELRAMTEALRHRGPDADGLLVDGHVGLGHRRLTIIDTSAAANQPMANEDGAVQVIFNGEIYNFQELRRRLGEAGHTLRTRSDTEVLVHLWEEHGEAMMDHLRGMFAFALYDRRARRLFLARDRIGKKPLYYRHGPQGFLFASEIKGLLAHPWTSRELDLAALGEYMVYGNTAGERSAYAEIRRLPPGCTLSLSTEAPARAPEIRRYWRFEPRPEPGLDVEAWLDEVDGILDEAVHLRMIADVPLGAFLSGGVDSSLVVAHMARLAPNRVETFCIGFEEGRWDESRHAQAVAEHLGTDHHTDFVTPDAVAVLPHLVEAYDEPFADPSAIPTYYVCQMTRKKVTVALSGDGGDELFFGYQRYWESETLRRLGRLLTPVGRAAAAGVGGLLPAGSYLRRAAERVSLTGFDLYHHAMGFAGDHRSLLAPEVARALGAGSEQKMAADFKRPPDLSFLDRCRAADMEGYLPDQILVKVDRASMHHSLEVRCPLLDQEVMAAAVRAPAALQMGRNQQKLLLRRLAYRYVPRELLERPKQGFAVPLERWFRGELAPVVEAALADEASPAWRYLDRAQARHRFQAHRTGRARCHTALWRILFFHAWARRHLR